MEFRDFLTQETASTMERLLLERSNQSHRQLEAFRDAFEAALETLESELVSASQEVHEPDLAAFVERLTAAAADQTYGATEAARLGAQKKIDELCALADAVSREAEKAQREDREVQERLERELQETRAELDRIRAESESLSERLETIQSERWSLEVALHDARGQIAHVEAQRALLASQRETNITHIESLERAARDAEEARRDLQIRLETATENETLLRDRLAGADALVKQMRAETESTFQATGQLERELASANARISELARRRTPEAGAPPAAPVSEEFDRLIALYQAFEDGSSVIEVLTMLAKGLSEQFARTALFSVNGSALQGAYQIGFDIDKDITKIIIPLALESVLSRAVASGCIETAAADDAPDGGQLPFGGASGWCLALPVPVNGETVGVIYADDGDHSCPDEAIQASRVSFADVARRHAVSVLARLTVDLKELAELGDYAALLLDEIEYIYEADASAGKQNMELVEQLTENLRCAQESYTRRLASATVIDSRADLFEERLNSLIDGKGATSFGRHLSIAAAAIAKREPDADASPSSRVAQAS
jgi:hypothetical protein